MFTSPTLNSQAGGQAENALGATLNRTLARIGGGTYHQIRAATDEFTARLYGDLPADDLATAGRVLTRHHRPRHHRTGVA